jgi:hypothetical protein
MLLATLDAIQNPHQAEKNPGTGTPKEKDCASGSLFCQISFAA